MLFNRVSTISNEHPPFPEKDKIFFQDFKHLSHLKEETKNYNTSTQNTNSVPSDFLVSKAFYPLLRIMQIVGNLPIRTKVTSGTIFYEFSVRSWIFFYSWVSFFGLTLMLATYIIKGEFGIDWPFQTYLHSNDTLNQFRTPRAFDTPSWILGVDQIFRIMIPAFALINIFAVRIRAKPIIQFVNGWASVLNEFESVFDPRSYKINLLGIVRAQFGFLPLLGAAYIGAIVNINRSGRRIFLADHWILTFWSKSTFVIFIVSAFVLSTIVTLLSLVTIKSFYREIRKAISHQYQETNGNLTYNQVKAWINLVTRVRDQVDFFIRFASLPELNDLFFTFVMVLTMSYMAISLYLENMQNFAGGTVPYAVGALGLAFIRTYVKGQCADLIVNEEHGIGLDVIEMRVPKQEGEKASLSDDEAYKARFEMSILCNMIFTSPVQIRLANIISLNKKLLLLIISQLASYLVVFLQFKRSPP